MKTYKEIIDIVEREVRNADAFPDATTKLQEQIDAVYRYAVAITKSLPLSKQVVEESAELTSAGAGGSLVELSLPADVNDAREDLGVHFISFANSNGSRTHISESSPLETVKRASTNLIQRSTFLFTFDPSSKKIFCSSHFIPATIHYAKKINLAVEADYDTVNVNLDDNSIEVLIEALASQFTSVNARDLSAAQIHSTLSQILTE